MGKPTYFSLLADKLLKISNNLRKARLKLKGLNLGEDCIVGKIICRWPNNVYLGNSCHVEDGVTFWIKEPFNEKNLIKLGNNVFVGRNCEFNCSSQIEVGDNCLIASKTVIVDVGHNNKLGELINIQPIIKQTIIIEEDVWIGTSCTILKGVRLGKGCIIGANSLVNKSVPSNEIWGGIPAKKIGERK